MRKWITLLMTCLVAGSISSANAMDGTLDVELGYRRDNVNWRLRTPSRDPVFRSNQRFKDLDIIQIGAEGRATIGCNFYLRANAYWGWILDGNYKRSFDFNFGNGGNDYSNGFDIGVNNRHRTTIDDKYVYGVGAAIGYPFYFCDCSTVVAPVIGYAFDEQSIQFEDREFAFGGDDYGSGSGCGGGNCCRRTFNSRWYGPFFGVDFCYRPFNACWNFYADVEYHWGSFRGRRSHNGNNGFERNRSSHDATGWVFEAGLDYELCSCWTLGLNVKFQDWESSKHRRNCNGNNFFDDGSDYGSGGRGSYCDRERQNARWHSYAINVTVGHNF